MCHTPIYTGLFFPIVNAFKILGKRKYEVQRPFEKNSHNTVYYRSMLQVLSRLTNTQTLSLLFGLIFIIFGWFVFLLAISGYFFFPLILFGALLAGIGIIYIGWKLFVQSSRDLRVAFLLCFFYAILLGFFSEPTLFSGRDQGSISEAAFRLAHNGELAFTTSASKSFFDIYGEGTALNFPGFAYTQEGYLITQFPLGYTAWLGSFITLFELPGITIANVILLFLFLFTFYQLLRACVHPFFALGGLLLTMTSFLPVWFAKITLSENFAVFLFTFLAWNTLLFLREKNTLSYAGILLSAGLLAFTRIEGFAFLLITLIILSFTQFARQLWKTTPWKSIILPGLIFIFIFLRDFFINLPYYKMIAKALIKFLRELNAGSITGDIANTGGSFTLGSIFFLYGLLIIFTLGIFGILLSIKEKKYLLLLPAFLALPTFIYLFDPNISLDHPWMLRRYLFSLFPTLLFSGVIALALLFAPQKDGQKNIFLPPKGKQYIFASLVFCGLALFQYPAWSMALPFVENRTLLKQIETFSAEFSDQDLILVDRNTTGNGFTMLTGPAQFLFGKNTVYFFNPADLDKLEREAFEKIYLLVPESDQSRYIAVFGERLSFSKTVTFTLEQFELLSLEDGSLPRLPKQTVRETRNLLFQIH